MLATAQRKDDLMLLCSILLLTLASASDADIKKLANGSLGRQKAFLQHLCGGRHPDHVFSIASTSAYHQEDEVDEAIQQHPIILAIKSGRIKKGALVMFTTIDRLSRSSGMVRGLVELCKEKKVELICNIEAATLDLETELKPLMAFAPFADWAKKKGIFALYEAMVRGEKKASEEVWKKVCDNKVFNTFKDRLAALQSYRPLDGKNNNGLPPTEDHELSQVLR